MEANLMRQFLSTSPAELLISSIWQGLLLTALAWSVLRFAAGLRASTRFTLWLIVFTLVALLPCFAIGRAIFGVPPIPTLIAARADFSLHANVAWAFAIEGLWLAASLFSLARLWASGKQMRALYRTSTPVAFETLSEELQSILARSASRPVEIRLSGDVDAPSVLGFFRPAVVVPQALWGELAADERKQIILHEMAHLDRGDDWTNLLQKLLRAFSPLNPALFWAERELCLERERACDDAVLDTAGNARAYATCLTKLAETRLVRRATSLAPGMWKRRSELSGRVENILHRRRRLNPLFSGGLVAASLFASVFGVLLLQSAPQVVTFASSDVLAAARPQAALDTARVYHAGYRNQAQPHYQEAVFHPLDAKTSNLPLKTEAIAQPKPRAAHKVKTSSRARFLQVRDIEDDDNGTRITLIFFTVETPQTAISLPDNWIVFQI